MFNVTFRLVDYADRVSDPNIAIYILITFVVLCQIALCLFLNKDRVLRMKFMKPFSRFASNQKQLDISQAVTLTDAQMQRYSEYQTVQQNFQVTYNQEGMNSIGGSQPIMYSGSKFTNNDLHNGNAYNDMPQ